MRTARTSVIEWDARPESLASFTTGVSLHGHTLHSQEGMQFIPRIAARIGWLRLAIDLAAKSRGSSGIHGVDWNRIYWTPPVTARQAVELEEEQIRSLGLRALVSLTDHDDISGPVQLRTLSRWESAMPVSVEWTFPFAGTFFHIGVHNLPPDSARALWAEMASATASGDETRLAKSLDALRGFEESLVVLNHPHWDEKGIGQERHCEALAEFLRLHGGRISALEYNGFRPSRENEWTLALGRTLGIPVLSGGDRHGHEPNSCLNLTAAKTFAEFVSEVKNTGRSTILLMPHQSQNHALRVIHHLWEILRDDPAHGLGWTRWDERVFYRDLAGEVRSLRDHWGDHPPGLVWWFVGLVHLMGHEPVRQLLRSAFSARHQPAR